MWEGVGVCLCRIAGLKVGVCVFGCAGLLGCVGGLGCVGVLVCGCGGATSRGEWVVLLCMITLRLTWGFLLKWPC